MITDIFQVIACRSQVSSNRMSSNEHSRFHYRISQYRKTVPIQRISTNTGRQYRYKRSVQIPKNDTILENSSSIDYELYTTIKIRIIVELLSRQAGMQASVHLSEAK